MARKAAPAPAESSLTIHNIREIVRLEEEDLCNRTTAERVGDSVAAYAGRMWYVALHGIWFLVWIGWNAHPPFGQPRFDPFPYPVLSLAISIESLILALFILMSQNRASRRADHRAHLDLQVNLLAESETTKVLSLLRALCLHHNLPEGHDPDLDELVKQIQPSDLSEKLGQHLPSNDNPPKKPA